MKKVLVLATVLIVSLSAVFAEYNKFGISDSTEIRKSVESSWLKANIDTVRGQLPLVTRNSVGDEFQVRLEEQEKTFAIVVAPLRMMDMDIYTETGIRREKMKMYPADAQGSWVLVRSQETGKPLYIRFYFTADSDVYVQFKPEKNKTLADFVIAGLYASRSVPVGVAFERLYTASFQTILRLTSKTLPWKYTDIVPTDYEVTMKMVSTIRKNLGRVVYCEGGVYDEYFKPAKLPDGTPREFTDEEKEKDIVLLSEEGFVKWIIDGLVEPVAGGGIKIKPLLQHTVEYKPQGLRGKNLDDFSCFNLDWCRNLASAWFSTQKGQTYNHIDSGLDVTKEPFAGAETEKGIAQVSGYTKDTGYKISQLRPFLYTLAAEEKSYFYLGAIRRPDPNRKPNEPQRYIFDRCAVFFPYFSSDGLFDCIVFENGREMTLKDFIKDNTGYFVHLSRCLASEKFYLQ